MAGKPEAQAQGAAGAAPVSEGGLLQAVIDMTPQAAPDQARRMVQALVGEAMVGSLVWDKNVTRTFKKAIDLLDAKISKQLAAIMHHPDFAPHRPTNGEFVSPQCPRHVLRGGAEKVVAGGVIEFAYLPGEAHEGAEVAPHAGRAIPKGVSQILITLNLDVSDGAKRLQGLFGNRCGRVDAGGIGCLDDCIGLGIADADEALSQRSAAETEADQIGIELAAKAGYDPQAAVSLWTKMNSLPGGKPPQFLSTHPNPENRIKALSALVPQMEPYYKAAGTPPMQPVQIVNNTAR